MGLVSRIRDTARGAKSPYLTLPRYPGEASENLRFAREQKVDGDEALKNNTQPLGLIDETIG